MNAQAIPTSVQTRRELAGGGLASLLLHAVAAALLFLHLRLDPAPEHAPKDMSVEVLIVEPKPEAPPESAVEQTVEAKPVIPDMPVIERPPPPQLESAPVAERSAPPPGPARQSTRAHQGVDSAGPSPTPAPQAPPAPPAAKAELSRGGGAGLVASLPRGGGDGPARQDEKDFLLAQVMPFWLLNYRDPRYARVIFHGTFVLRADGMLDFPYGKNDPWDPQVMIGGYDQQLTQQYRVAIESFLRAVRAAQPFRLQPGIDSNSYPRSIPVYFRLGDL